MNMNIGRPQLKLYLMMNPFIGFVKPGVGVDDGR